MSTATVTVSTICRACNEYAWQTSFDLDDPRDGFADVEDVLWSERDDEAYFLDLCCDICATDLSKGWVKYSAGVVFRN